MTDESEYQSEYQRGVRDVVAVFDGMWASGDWDGQVSIGFASIFAQATDELLQSAETSGGIGCPDCIRCPDCGVPVPDLELHALVCTVNPRPGATTVYGAEQQVKLQPSDLEKWQAKGTTTDDPWSGWPLLGPDESIATTFEKGGRWPYVKQLPEDARGRAGTDNTPAEAALLAAEGAVESGFTRTSLDWLERQPMSPRCSNPRCVRVHAHSGPCLILGQP